MQSKTDQLTKKYWITVTDSRPWNLLKYFRKTGTPAYDNSFNLVSDIAKLLRQCVIGNEWDFTRLSLSYSHFCMTQKLF